MRHVLSVKQTMINSIDAVERGNDSPDLSPCVIVLGLEYPHLQK